MTLPGIARRLLALALLGLAALASVASAGEPSTYCIRRAALVPAPAPALRPARQPQGYVEVNASSETVAYARPPRRLDGANVGLYVPREQLSGQLLLSPHRVLTIGASFEAGLAAGAIPISKGLIAPPKNSIGGGGAHLALHFQVNPRVTIGLTCDAWAYQVASRIAYIQAHTCDGLSDPRSWHQKTASTTMFVGRAQLATGIDFGRSHLTVGVGLRNHPVNVGESIEEHDSPSEIEPRIGNTVYPYVYVGWEFRVYRGLYLGATVYQPLMFDPVIYAPILGINLRLTHLARERTEWKGKSPEPVTITPYPY